MAFASVEDSAPFSGSGAATSHDVPLPGTVSAGAQLFIWGRVAVAGTVAITGGGWTIVQDSSDASDDVTFLARRDALADGTEDGTTVTVTHGSGKMSAISFSVISEHVSQAPELSTVAVGTGSNPGPTGVTPTGGAKDYLWIALGAADGEHTAPPATIPANYGGSVGAGSGTGGTPGTNSRVYLATRQLNAASEDPGTWTTSVAVNSGWTAYTLAIHPAAAVEYTDSGTVYLDLQPSGVEEPRRGIVYWAEFEIPEASVGTEYTDSGTVTLAFTPSGTDLLAKEYTDSGIVSLGLVPSGTDVLEVVDASTVTLTLTPEGTEFLGHEYIDAAEVGLLFTPSGTDAFEAVDAGTALITLTPSGIDEYTPLQGTEYTDAATVVLTLTASGVDELDTEYTDADTVSLVFTPSGTDAFEGVDADTVVLTFTPSGVDDVDTEYTDADTATLTLTPSAVEVFAGEDAATALVALTPSGVDEYTGNTSRRGIVYWAEFEIPEAAEEYIDSGTVYLDLQPSGVDEFTGTSYDEGEVYLKLTLSSIDVFAGTPVPGSVRGLMALYVSEAVVGFTDAATVLLSLSVSSTEARETADASTIGLSLSPSATESATLVDATTINLVFSPSGTEYVETGYVDTATVPIALSPSSVDVSEAIDTGAIDLKLTPSGDDLYVPPAGTTVGTVTLKLTPITTVEVYYLFDVFLGGVLSRHWSASTPISKWSGVMTQRWSGTSLPRRFAGAMANRKWSAAMSRKWSGFLGRF